MKRLGSISCRAFTLIELSIVLVFVSLILSFGMQAVQTTGATDCYAVTRTQMVEINNAFTRYLSRNTAVGQVALPAPAGRGLRITDPLYGKSSVVNSTAANNLYYGALPFATLGLPSSFAADCWGNKFTYAVVQSLTVAGTAVGQYSHIDSRGIIVINTGITAAPKPVYTQAGYVVISHGADGSTKGAAPRNGSKAWCAASTSIDPPDKENCDTGNAIFFSSPFNSGSTSPAYFDDMVVYGSKAGPTGMAGINNGSTGIGSACVAGSVTWGGSCTASVGSALLSGQTTTVSSASPTGSATVTCTNARLVATGTCGVPCSGSGTVTWMEAGKSCSYSPAPGLEGGTNAGPYQNTVSGFTGSATISCDGATGILSAAGTCKANCAGGSVVQWTQGSHTCQGTTSEVNGDGSTGIVSNTTSGLTGQGTFICTNGVASTPSGTCAPSNGKCPAGTQATWGTGGNCRYTVGNETNDGWSMPNVPSTNAGYSGTATITCNGSSGLYTVSSATCGQDCPATAVNQSASGAVYRGVASTNGNPDRCGYDVPYIKFNSSVTIANNTATPPGFNALQSGSATFTCDGTSGTKATQSQRSCTQGTLAARCWGGNSLGQLGDGSTATSSGATLTRNPVNISNYSQIAANRNYTCGISSWPTVGRVYCWGGNLNGEFGQTPNTSSPFTGSGTAYTIGASFTLPQQLSFPTDGVTAATSITQLSAANGMLCVIDNSNRTWCQGRNTYGALGNNTAANTDNATNVSNGWVRVDTGTVTGFSTIATDWFHTCGIASAPAGVANKVFCWGNNSAGQIGDGSTTDRIIPTAVDAGNDYTEIATLGETLSGSPDPSIASTCALRSTGAVFCWGNNSRGQIGDATTTQRNSPTAVYTSTTTSGNAYDTGTGISGLRGGGNRACYIATFSGNTRAYCWGDNTNEAIGNRANDSSGRAPGSGGYVHTSRDASGSSYTSFSVRPALVSRNGSGNFSQVATGGSTTCMRSTDTTNVFCVGSNTLRQLGDNATTTEILATPAIPVSILNNSNDLAIGSGVSTAATARTIAISGNHGCTVMQ